MNLILRYLEGRKSAPGVNPKLTQELNQTKQDLAQILNKWNWDGASPKNATEFLNKFAPWVEEKIKLDKELKVFLAKKGLTNLQEAEHKLTNRDLSENEELNQLRKELAETQQKHEQELAQQEQTFLNTEQDYLKQIEELKNRLEGETSEDYEDLITERDQLARDKHELEQDLLATNNRLRNKQEELRNKEKALDKLKKEQAEEIKKLKDKYSKQGKLLDTEQLECKKLEEENEKLKAEIQQLKGGSS